MPHLLGGGLDVAILSTPARDRRLVSRSIFSDEMVIIVDPRHPLAGRPFVTAADLASFRPARPSLTGEPAGFGIVGAPTNVVAAASEQYMTGTLLGWNVTVRFVPDGYVFDYGDGSTERSATGGPPPQVTPTASAERTR